MLYGQMTSRGREYLDCIKSLKLFLIGIDWFEPFFMHAVYRVILFNLQEWKQHITSMNVFKVVKSKVIRVSK